MQSAFSDGQSRATSSKLLFRARRDQGVDALPSAVGQMLGTLGIPSTTSKGKSRFLLDTEYLEPLLADLQSQIQTLEQRVEAVLGSVGDIQRRLAPLEDRLQRIHRQILREQELEQFLKENQPQVGQTRLLQFEIDQVKAELARQQSIKAQIQQLSIRLADLFRLPLLAEVPWSVDIQDSMEAQVPLDYRPFLPVAQALADTLLAPPVMTEPLTDEGAEMLREAEAWVTGQERPATALAVAPSRDRLGVFVAEAPERESVPDLLPDPRPEGVTLPPIVSEKKLYWCP